MHCNTTELLQELKIAVLMQALGVVFDALVVILCCPCRCCCGENPSLAVVPACHGLNRTHAQGVDNCDFV